MALYDISLLVPAYAAALSCIILFSHSVYLIVDSPEPDTGDDQDEILDVVSQDDEGALDTMPAGIFAEIRAHASLHGGMLIFTYKVARLLGCLVLLGLTAVYLVLDEIELGDDSQTLASVPLSSSFANLILKPKKKRKGQKLADKLSQQQWHLFTLCLTYLYCTCLALLCLVEKPLAQIRHRTGWIRSTHSSHLVCVLLVTLMVFCVRDIWPLCTYTLRPLDLPPKHADIPMAAPLLWSHIGILAWTAVIIPLISPRAYVPIDRKNASMVPNAEQTCSLFSLITYSFLDSVIFMAYRVPHLDFEQLPPLADYDCATFLRNKAFPFLDPFSAQMKRTAKRRHIFFALMSAFAREYIVMIVMVIISTSLGFAAPIGVNRLLNYMETGGEDAFVRPWIWILWLFFGPLIRSMAFQWYIWTSTGAVVRAESIITQLVFEHALRIRVRAETEIDSSPANDQPTPNQPGSSKSPLNAPASASGAASSGNNGPAPTVGREAVATSDAKPTFGNFFSRIRSRFHPDAKASGLSKPKPGDKSKLKREGPANLQGRITNLITTDLGNITDGRNFVYFLVPIPLQIALCIWFLYAVLGWSAFVGMGAMVLLYPLPGYVAKLLQRVQRERMKRTDARVQSVTETMNLVRMVKLFGWEREMDRRISEKREDELAYLRKRQLLEVMNWVINYAVPLVTMMASYTTYTLVMKEELTPSKVFSSMTVFDMLRDQLHVTLYAISTSIEGKVSLDRLDDFLWNSELLDRFSDHPSRVLGTGFIPASLHPNGKGREPSNTPGILDLPPSSSSTIVASDAGYGRPPPGYESSIGFRDAAFTWSAAQPTDPPENSRPSSSIAQRDATYSDGVAISQRHFVLKVDGELLFRRGCVNIIVGPTGCGKTSLLMALLGEMHFISESLESWYQLPDAGGVSYAAQESWVQNETIRDNILFGAPFDEERYNKVVHQCCLERDLEMFEAGDRTEVGEKGITLSGGQKARITLARAIYARTEVVLLDDVLAALDIHTSKWIVDKCFSGDLLQGRTVILVTHNIALVKSVAAFIVSMDPNGRIASHGSVTKVLQEDTKLAGEVIQAEKVLDKVEAEPMDASKPEQPSGGKLIIKEEVELGHVGWPAVKMYLAGLGGKLPALFFLGYFGGCILVQILMAGQTWYLGHWAAQYENHHPWEVPVAHYLTVYGLLLLVVLCISTLQDVIFIFGGMRASRSLHRQLIQAVLGTTWRWLDTTPISRIITRCTQDIRAVDGPVPNRLRALSDMSMDMIVKFAAVVIFAPIFIGPGVALLIIGGWCGQIYMAGQLSVKREMSNAKAPVLGHLGAAITGLVSIRAYGAQEAFKREACNRIDRYTRAGRTFYNLNRWVSVRMDALAGVFTASLAVYLLYISGQSAANTGFSLNMAVGFSSMIMWAVRVLNDFEVQGNSLERIQGYLSVEQEPKPTSQGKPPAYWPASGDIVVENLSARYSANGPNVLRDVTFRIRSGERIGIVGRTGSGKSSLTLSLLRCIPTDGTVYFDGIPTASINLEDLRSNVTLIPQVPELLSGTLRRNIDPFGQHDDATLNDALRAAGLFSLQSETDDDRITLDTPIASGGGNLSVGQRQILALARAIVRRSKLLILDEATSAIDYKTDAVIQSSLRTELRDVTVITVAHRLQTIMDADKIMVLDSGRIAEFDAPKELLKKTDGMLRALVDESGDREALVAMAESH